MKNRYKSWVLWAAVASLLIFILKTYCGIIIPQVDVLVNMVLSIMVMVGIVNNPTDPDKL